jgi:hypothetical protein
VFQSYNLFLIAYRISSGKVKKNSPAVKQTGLRDGKKLVGGQAKIITRYSYGDFASPTKRAAPFHENPRVGKNFQ